MPLRIKPRVPILRREHPLAAGLAAFWPFHEAAGATARNLCPNSDSNDLTSTGTWTAGPDGPAVALDGSSQQLGLAAPAAALNFSRNFSVAVRFRVDAGGNYYGLVSHGSGSWYLRVTSAGKLNFLQSQTADVLSGATTVTVGDLHTAVATVGSGSTAAVNVYLDGRPDGSGTTSVTFSGAAGLAVGADLAFGPTYSERLPGRVDRVAVYGRELTPGEVASLHADPYAIFRAPASQRLFLPAAGGGSSSGAGTAAGTSTASGVGASTASAAGTAAGTSTAPGIGSATDASVGTAAGTSTVAGVGSSVASASGPAAGTSTASGTGSEIASAIGTAAGTSTAPGSGSEIASASGTAAGTSTADATGTSASQGSGTGTAAGTSTADATGSSTARGTGAASGTSTALGSGSEIASAAGSAAGTSTAAGAGTSTTAGSSGTASGTSTAPGSGASTVAATGTASGTSTVSGSGSSSTVPIAVRIPPALLWWWCDAATAPTIDLPADLPAAVAKVIDDSGLIASVAANAGTPPVQSMWAVGKAWHGLAEDDPGDYYISFVDPAWSFNVLMGDPYVRVTTIQFHCFAPTISEAQRIAEGVVSLFNPRMDEMEFVGGRVSGAWPMAGGMDWAEYRNESNTPLRRCYVGVKFTTDRTFA